MQRQFRGLLYNDFVLIFTGDVTVKALVCVFYAVLFSFSLAFWPKFFAHLTENSDKYDEYFSAIVTRASISRIFDILVIIVV